MLKGTSPSPGSRRSGTKKNGTDVQILRGNPTGLPIPKDEPKPVVPIGEAPEWMSEAQRARWDHAIRQMPPGFLREADSDTLAQYVVASCNFALACARQNAKKMDIVSDECIKIRKAIEFEGAIMARAGSLLGFNPSSRASLGHAQMKTQNAFERFKTGPHVGEKKPAVLHGK